MNQYVLDTSALLAYIENEDGADEMDSLLRQALQNQLLLFMSVMSSVEIFYISWQEQGMVVAVERLKLLNDLPITQVALDNQLVQLIGEIKATKKMSLADSFTRSHAGAWERLSPRRADKRNVIRHSQCFEGA